MRISLHQTGTNKVYQLDRDNIGWLSTHFYFYENVLADNFTNL
jgi:hypothetical protein